MLTEIYVEALLVDEELADQVWGAWDGEKIDNFKACLVWWWMIVSGTHKVRPPGPPQIWNGVSTFFAVAKKKWARWMNS